MDDETLNTLDELTEEEMEFGAGIVFGAESDALSLVVGTYEGERQVYLVLTMSDGEGGERLFPMARMLTPGDVEGVDLPGVYIDSDASSLMDEDDEAMADALYEEDDYDDLAGEDDED